MKDLRSQSMLLPIIATVLFFLLSWPVWQWLWNEWTHNEYYSHGPLIPLVALFLAVQRFRLRRQVPLSESASSKSASSESVSVQTISAVTGNAHRADVGNFSDESTLTETSSHHGPLLTKVLGWVWIGGSLLLYLFFLNDSAYYLAAFAVVALLVGLVWLFGGTHLLREWSFPLAYLVLMIPLPFVERATYPLAIFAGLCGGGIVQWLGMEISIIGNAVTLPNADLVIGAQCSGINSLIALSALMIVAAYILDGALWGRVALVILAVPLAILGNILRIASLLFVARSYGVESAFTFYHDYSGLVFFLVVLLLMFPLTRLLQINTLRLDVI